MRRGERVRVKTVAKVTEWFQGKGRQVRLPIAAPVKWCWCPLWANSAVQHFLAKDLERIG